MPHDYAIAEAGSNQCSLGGNWTVGAERARLNSADGSIDGRAPGADHGSDTDVDGNGSIGDTRLYQLVRQSGAVKEHLFEIRFLDAGASAFAFTFG